MPSSFNITQTIDSVGEQVEDNLKNFTDAAVEYVKDIADEFWDSVMDLDFDEFEFPTFNYDFNNLTVPDIPEANLRFTFDGLELYMLVDTILSLGATYTLPLYKSKTPVGIYITEELQLGLIFSVDLILATEGSIDVSSGIHLKLDDGFAVNIALFGEDASDITL